MSTTNLHVLRRSKSTKSTLVLASSIIKDITKARKPTNDAAMTSTSRDEVARVGGTSDPRANVEPHVGRDDFGSTHSSPPCHEHHGEPSQSYSHESLKRWQHEQLFERQRIIGMNPYGFCSDESLEPAEAAHTLTPCEEHPAAALERYSHEALKRWQCERLFERQRGIGMNPYGFCSEENLGWGPGSSSN